jgi:hypothetical protein
MLAKLVIRGSYDSSRMNGVDSPHASPCPMCWNHLMPQACNAGMCTAVLECLEHLLKTHGLAVLVAAVPISFRTFSCYKLRQRLCAANTQGSAAHHCGHSNRQAEKHPVHFSHERHWPCDRASGCAHASAEQGHNHSSRQCRRGQALPWWCCPYEQYCPVRQPGLTGAPSTAHTVAKPDPPGPGPYQPADACPQPCACACTQQPCKPAAAHPCSQAPANLRQCNTGPACQPQPQSSHCSATNLLRPQQCEGRGTRQHKAGCDCQKRWHPPSAEGLNAA